jgi:anti-sigma factor RsiW
MNAPLDDKQLREYLLGGLTPEERGQIEYRLFDDDDFADSLRETEADLLDGFTSGTLNEEDRRRFAALAGNPAWAAKLEVSQWIARQSAPLGWRTRTTPRWLGWAAALIAAIVAGWMARENGRLRALPDKPAASLVASISMGAGTQREGSDRTFVIPASSEVLRVELPAESGYEDYVLTVEGSGVSFSVPAALRGETVVGWIPSAILPPGHYDFLLKARRGGASELLATYPVKIERN